MTKCTNLNKSEECSLDFVEIKEENFEEKKSKKNIYQKFLIF